MNLEELKTDIKNQYREEYEGKFPKLQNKVKLGLQVTKAALCVGVGAMAVSLFLAPGTLMAVAACFALKGAITAYGGLIFRSFSCSKLNAAVEKAQDADMDKLLDRYKQEILPQKQLELNEISNLKTLTCADAFNGGKQEQSKTDQPPTRTPKIEM